MLRKSSKTISFGAGLWSCLNETLTVDPQEGHTKESDISSKYLPHPVQKYSII